MSDEELARIMYLVVHDFQIQMIENGRAEKEDLEPDSRNIAESIRKWAMANHDDYPAIKRHAETVIEWIDAETFDIDSV